MTRTFARAVTVAALLAEAVATFLIVPTATARKVTRKRAVLPDPAC